MAHDGVTHFGGVHHDIRDVTGDRLYHRIVCGHCGSTVGAAVIADDPPNYWLRCPVCRNGSVLVEHALHGRRAGRYFVQHPSPLPAADIDHVPPALKRAYDEARRCFSVQAYAATEVVCRKVLAHIAVDRGADPGRTFLQYVEHLEKIGFITPPMLGWAGLIRTHGNAAVHDLEEVDRDRAEATLAFTGQLLRIAYEMPGMAQRFLDPG